MKNGIADFLPRNRIRTTHWHLQHLLRSHERIDMNGKGVKILLKASLEDILFRWAVHMVEMTLHKIRPVIEILEEQLIFKNVFSKDFIACKFLNEADEKENNESDSSSEGDNHASPDKNKHLKE